VVRGRRNKAQFLVDFEHLVKILFYKASDILFHNDSPFVLL